MKKLKLIETKTDKFNYSKPLPMKLSLNLSLLLVFATNAWFEKLKRSILKINR